QVLDDRGQLIGFAALGRRDRGGRAEDRHRERLIAPLARHDTELDALARLERLHVLWQRRGMDEDVTAVVAGEEAEALLAVEPLDLAGRPLLVLVLARPRRPTTAGAAPVSALARHRDPA